MDIELNMRYEKKAIGQVLEELAKDGKRTGYVISVETIGQPTGTPYTYDRLEILGITEKNGQFDLVLRHYSRGFEVRKFYWPVEAIEDYSRGIPIFALTVLAINVEYPRLKKLMRRIFCRRTREE